MDERNFNYWHKEYLIKTIFQPDSGVEWTRICAWTMTQNWVCKMKFKNRPLEKKSGDNSTSDVYHLDPVGIANREILICILRHFQQ